MPKKQNPALFEDYIWGMPKKEIIEKSGAGSCPDERSNPLTLCASEPVNYAGVPWREIFWFNNDNELRQVMLSRSGSVAGDFNSILNTLPSLGWVPIFLETPDGALDILEETRINGAEKTEDARNDFEEKALKNGASLTILFFPADFGRKSLNNSRLKSYSQAMAKAPENFCVLSLMLEEDNLKLSFTAPLLTRKDVLKYGQKINR